MLSSHQIGSIAAQQQAMFGNFQSYAQQITPPYAAGGASPMSGNPASGYGQSAPSYQPVMGGYSSAPPPPPPPPMMAPSTGMYMQQSGNLFGMGMAAMQSRPGSYIGQAFGEQLAGTALGGFSSGMQGLGTVAGVAGLAGAGMGMLGVGGSVAGGLAAAGGAPVTLGIAGAAYGAQQMYTGFQQQQNVGRVLRQNFGGMMGVGSGAGGMGFSSGEMGGIGNMVREMSSKDMFVGFDELTRVMDQTAQMGMYRGVQSAKQFREKFRATVASLKEVAETMHSSLEEAASFMGQQKQLGFFSGSEINQNLMRTKLMAGSTGMSVEQLQQAGMQGTQMGRAMGMLGRTGARVMQETTSNIAMGMRTGAISTELIAEATGGLTGAEGAQAAAGRMMQINQRWLRRGVGRVELAALWDSESGGINQDVLEQVRSGNMSFRQMRNLGRRNISRTGGRRSEFFLNEERLRGMAMEQAGGDLMLGALRSHLDKRGVDMDSPIAQRWLQRQNPGMSRSEADLFIQQAKELPGILRERRVANRQQIENEAMNRARKGLGVGGLKRRWSQWWESNVENPFRKVGADLTTSMSEAVEEFQADMEGTIKLQVSARAKSAMKELATTGKSDLLQQAAKWQQGLDVAGSREAYESTLGARVGRMLGTRIASADDRLAALEMGTGGRMAGLYHKEVLRPAQRAGKEVTAAQKTNFLNKVTRGLTKTAGQLGFAGQIGGLGAAAKKVLDQQYGVGKMSAARGMRAARARAVAGEGGNETTEFLDQRIALYSRSDPELAKAFAKTPIGPERYALLREIENRAGLGEDDLRRSPVDVMLDAAGVTDVGNIAALVEASRDRQEDVAEEFAASLLGGDEYIEEEGWAGERHWSALKKWRTGSAKDYYYKKDGKVYTHKVEGGKKFKRKMKRSDVEKLIAENKGVPQWVREQEGKRIEKVRGMARGMVKAFEDEDVREMTAKAISGGEGSAKALEDLRNLSMKKDLRPGQRQIYEEVIKTIESGTGEQKEKLRNMFAGDLFEGIVALSKRESEVGRNLANDLTSNTRLQKALNEVDPAADDELQEIANLRANAMTDKGIDPDSLEKAYAKERDFLSKYANDPKAGRMIGALNASGGGTYLGAGLDLARDIMQKGTGKKGPTTRRVLDLMLERKFGVTLKDLGVKGKDRRKLIEALESGGMTGEKFREFLGDKGKKAFDSITDQDIDKSLGDVFTAAKGGVDKGELTEMAAKAGAEESQAARAKGAAGQLESLNSLAVKQVAALDQIVKGQTTLVQMTGTSMRYKQEDIDKLVKAIKGGGNTDPPAG